MASHDAPTKIPERGWHCPPAEQLAAYVDGQVGDEQRKALERHLADCGYCLKSVAGAMSDVKRPAAVTPVWLRQQAEAQAGNVKSKNWRWEWVLAPALACLLVAVVLVESPKQTRNVVSTGAPPPSTSVATSPAGQTGNALPGATRSLKTQTEPLQLLAPASGALLEDSQLRFEWNATPNAASYRIRITTPDGALVWEARSEQAHTQVPPSVKIAPGSYFAWVTAYIDDGRELESAPVEFRVQTGR